MSSLSQSTLIRGDSRIINVAVVSEDRSPIDISGAVVHFTLSKVAAPTDDTSAALSKRWTDHSDPAHGKTSIRLTNADTQDLEPGEYYYDVQVRDALGEITSTYRRTIAVRADISRSIN